MALFRKDATGKSGGKAAPEAKAPTTPRVAFCRVCDEKRKFTRCWRRTRRLTECESCGAGFEDPVSLYERFQPACPNCDEFLEQPTFEYGLCDECGSRYELMAGTPPNLLPNQSQRADMNKNGPYRSIR